MKIPKKIKVAGHTYKIKWDDEFLSNQGYTGLACHRELIIYICKKYRGDKLAKSVIEETFLHEILHSVDVSYNEHSLDEDTVARLAEGLYHLIRIRVLVKIKSP